jgi:hypothetical protein
VAVVVEWSTNSGRDDEMLVADGTGKVDTAAADGLAEVRAVGSSVCVANFHSAWVLRGCMFHWRCDVRG